MEEQEKQLCMLNKTVFWLAIVSFAFLLSVMATLRQRAALCLTIQGDTQAAQEVGAVFPLRSAASTLFVLGLTFFFWATQQGPPEETLTPIQAQSVCWNRWAALLVLAAAILRLWDVNETQRRLTAGEQGVVLTYD